MSKTYDRSAEDLGNVVGLEHVNVTVPDQGLATLFYVSGLGLTRDPYMMTSIDNMWINVGPRSQFHLPTGSPQVLRGQVGLVIPDRAQLLTRLGRVKDLLRNTRFGFTEHEDYVEAICPWGNVMRCHEPSARFGRTTLSMPYVAFDVPMGAAKGIAAFYRDVMGTGARVEEEAGVKAAHVSVGRSQELVFRETDAEPKPYDNHHIQVYVASFSGPHKALAKLGLVSEESNQYQYRFNTITDPENGKELFKIEHEVRSLTHPMYARPLVNRDPQQNNRNYAEGHDAWMVGIRESMDNPRDMTRRRL
jgi:hypothetical protein